MQVQNYKKVNVNIQVLFNIKNFTISKILMMLLVVQI